MNQAAAPPAVLWTTWREIGGVLTQPHNVKRTLIVALAVGTAFFAMNQLGPVLSGEATPLTWLKVVLTYLTPLCVSNIGVLSATHRRQSTTADTSGRGKGSQ